jgi:hypothetical protein
MGDQSWNPSLHAVEDVLLFLLAVFLGALWLRLATRIRGSGMWWVVHQRQEFSAHLPHV